MKFAQAWIHVALVAFALVGCGGGGGSAGAGNATISASAVAAVSTGDGPSGSGNATAIAGIGTGLQDNTLTGSFAGFYVAVVLDSNSPSVGRSSLNAKGHVAFTSLGQGWFYDGLSVRALGTLGGAESAAKALNDQDQVTGFSTTTLGGVQHAFLWSDGIMRDLGGPPGRAFAGQAINSLGHVAGTSSDIVGSSVAFLWTPQAGLADIGTTSNLPGLANTTSGLINTSDAVVGQASAPTVNDESLAFIWTPLSGMRSLGTLGGLSAVAQAMSEASQVVGKAAMPDGRLHAFSWTLQDGMLDLGTLGGGTSNALAINQAGQIVGESEMADMSSHAFLWGPAGTAFMTMIDLGSLGGGTSRAADINDFGQVVGTAQMPDGTQRAFIWTAANGMVDLNTRLAVAPVGLELHEAVAISNNGSVLAQSNQGLVLLKPSGSGPVTGSIQFDQQPSALPTTPGVGVRGVIDTNGAQPSVPLPTVPVPAVSVPSVPMPSVSPLGSLPMGMASVP